MGSLHILSTICIHVVIWLQTNATEIDIPWNASLVVYYNTESGEAFAPVNVTDQSLREPDKRVAFRSNGCSCQNLTCGCCTGINIQQFNFKQEGCLNFTYDPFEFSIAMNAFMNDNKVFTNTISAKNPPPLCIPFGVPNVPLPSLEFCARLFDLHMPGSNLQMCLDFETRIERAPVLVLHFDCMRMGTYGFTLVKPGATLPPPPNATTPTEASVTDVDTYDEVTEVKYKEGRTH